MCTLNVGNDVMFTEGSPTPKNGVRVSKSLGSPKISHIFHKISLAKIGILLPSLFQDPLISDFRISVIS